MREHCPPSTSPAGPAHQQRYSRDCIVPGIALAVAQVFAEPLAVVGREDDDGIVRKAEPVEPVENAADVVIDLGYHRVIAVARGAQFVVGKVLWASASVESRREGRQRQRGRIVEIEELLRGHPRDCAANRSRRRRGRGRPYGASKTPWSARRQTPCGSGRCGSGWRGRVGEAFRRMRDPVADVHNPLPLD